jgi:hypothetical protein
LAKGKEKSSQINLTNNITLYIDGQSFDKHGKVVEMKWSETEKEVARRAFNAAYECECMAIAYNVREMANKINEPSDVWRIHDYLTEKRSETDQKYDYRYTILLSVFARLMCEGWIRKENLEGLSCDKLQEIHRAAEFKVRV